MDFDDFIKYIIWIVFFVIAGIALTAILKRFGVV
jgi:hypothetical protein